jgi:Protein of unknown function (DUF3224)
MKRPSTARAAVAVAVCLGLGPLTYAQTPSTHTPKETTMTETASGSFEVKLTPQAPDAALEGTATGRMLIDKQFHGDLEAVSKGQMLAFRSAVEGSAGYVAIEEVSGTLGGRRGTFVLQHNGTMRRGEPRLSVTVVPDSGTEQLTGLSGTMSIDIRDGGHFYEFEYSLAEAP